MSFRNPLDTTGNIPGSLSAINMAASVASNPIGLAVVGVVGLVGLTVAGGVFAYRDYKAYEEKKHRQ